MTLLTLAAKYVVQSTSTVTKTSTSLALDTPATQDFSVNGSQVVLAIYTANCTSSDSNGVRGTQIAIHVDSTNYSLMNNSPNSSTSANRNSTFWIGVPSNGSHTISGYVASLQSSTTITITNRTLEIYVFNGTEYDFVDNTTSASTASGSYTADSHATVTRNPSASCTLLALYAATNTYSSTEATSGKGICIQVGATQYTQCEALQCPYGSTYPDSNTTFYIVGSVSGSTTTQGYYKSIASANVTISRSVIGVLYLDPTYTDYSLSSDTTHTTTTSSTTFANDTYATVSKTTNSSQTEALIFAIATQKASDSGVTGPGFGYGINLDSAGSPQAVSRCSDKLTTTGGCSVFVSYGATITAGDHTIYGQQAENTAANANNIDERVLGALWMVPAVFIASTCSDGAGTSTVSVSNYLTSTCSDGTGGSTANEIVLGPEFIISTCSDGAGSITANLSPGSLLTFNSQYVIQNSTVITSTSTTLGTDTYASQTFTLTKPQTVLAIYSANNDHGDTEAVYGTQIAINVDSTNYCIMKCSPTQANYANCNTSYYCGLLAAGSHTISGQFAAITGTTNTATIHNRTLVILIFDGNEVSYVDNSTSQSTSNGSSWVADTHATVTKAPSASCTALILYAVSNNYNATEDTTGIAISINVGGTTYPTHAYSCNSPSTNNYPTSVCVSYALTGVSGSKTYKGQIEAFTNGTTVTINRSVLGVLFFDPNNCAVDSVDNSTTFATTSTSFVNDTSVQISRTVSGTMCQLLVLSGTYSDDNQSPSNTAYGIKYGINLDNQDVAYSNMGDDICGEFVAYASYVPAASHTINGRICSNHTGSNASKNNSIMQAIWFNSNTVPLLSTCSDGVGSATAIGYLTGPFDISSTCSDGAGTTTAGCGLSLQGSLLTFSNKYVVQSTTTKTTTSSTLAIDTPATQTFTLTQTQTILAIYTANSNPGDTGYNRGFQSAINVDSTNYCLMNNSSFSNTAANRNTSYWIGSLDAGSHTISGYIAAITNGQTTTISNRTLLIYIFDGANFYYLDNQTSQTTTSSSYVFDQYANTNIVPPSSCIALAIYASTNLNTATESSSGTYTGISIGGSSPQAYTYSVPYGSAYASSGCSAVAQSVSSTTQFAGSFSSPSGSTVTISRSVLGILFLNSSYTSLYSLSDGSSHVTTSSTSLVNDTAATINVSSAGTTSELLVLGTTISTTSMSTSVGIGYGFNIYSSDVVISKSCSPGSHCGLFIAYGQSISAGSITIQGRLCSNDGNSQGVDGRFISTIRFRPVSSSLVSGSGDSTANNTLQISISSTCSDGTGDSTASNTTLNFVLLSSICSDGAGDSTANLTISSGSTTVDLSSTCSDSVGSVTANDYIFDNIDSQVSGSGDTTCTNYVFEFIDSLVSGSGSFTATNSLNLAISSSCTDGFGDVTANDYIFDYIDSSVSGTGISSTTEITDDMVFSSEIGSGSSTVNLILLVIIDSSVSGLGSSTANPVNSICDGSGSSLADNTLNIAIDSSVSGYGDSSLNPYSSIVTGSGSSTADDYLFDYLDSSVSGSGTAQSSLVSSVVSGSGDSSAIAYILEYITSLVSSSSESSAYDYLFDILESTSSGSGDFTADNTLQLSISSESSGSGSVTATNFLGIPVSSSCTDGAGSVTSDDYLFDYLESYVFGSGYSSTSGESQNAIYSYEVGVGSATADDYLFDYLESSSTGSGSSTATNTLYLAIDSSGSGSGSVTVNCYIFEYLSSTCSDGVGSESCSNSILLPITSTSYDGIGSSNSTGYLFDQLDSLTSGSGDVTANDYIFEILSSSESGTGSSTSNNTLYLSLTSTIDSGIGYATCNVLGILALVSEALGGPGSVVADDYLIDYLDSSESGTGSVTSFSYILVTVSSSVTGSGSSTADNLLFLSLTSSVSSSIGSSTATDYLFDYLVSTVYGYGYSSTSSAAGEEVYSTELGTGSASATISLFDHIDSSSLGQGSETADLIILKPISSTVTGSGSETATESIFDHISSSKSGSGSATATPTLIKFVSSTDSGSGSETSILTNSTFIYSSVEGYGSSSGLGSILDSVTSICDGQGSSVSDAEITTPFHSVVSGVGTETSYVTEICYISGSGLGSGISSARFTWKHIKYIEPLTVLIYSIPKTVEVSTIHRSFSIYTTQKTVYVSELQRSYTVYNSSRTVEIL